MTISLHLIIRPSREERPLRNEIRNKFKIKMSQLSQMFQAGAVKVKHDLLLVFGTVTAVFETVTAVFGTVTAVSGFVTLLYQTVIPRKPWMFDLTNTVWFVGLMSRSSAFPRPLSHRKAAARAAENLNKSKLKTNTSTRKSTFTLVTLPSFSISGEISAEKMYVEN